MIMDIKKLFLRESLGEQAGTPLHVNTSYLFPNKRLVFHRKFCISPFSLKGGGNIHYSLPFHP